MKPVLLWSSRAREDLMEIYLTIGMDNVDAAERVYTAIEERIASLVLNPRMGVRRSEIAPSARMLVYGMYLVLYETWPDTDHGALDSIEIVRIVHGNRDLTRLF